MKLRDVTAPKLKAMMSMLNWQGHVELSDMDMGWLASAINAWLHDEKRGRCDVCGNAHELIITMPLGDICEDCIETLADQATETREAAEGV